MGIDERSFEDAVEAALTAAPAGPTGETFGAPGGFRARSHTEYDRERCLLPRDVLDFVMTTQPNEWKRLAEHYGTDVDSRLIDRIAREVQTRGVLSVLRGGVKDSGVKVKLCASRPSSGLNPDIQRLYEANVFTVVRQLRYSTKGESSIDTVLFLNGLPIITLELKNPMTGQNHKDAINQYRRDRDPREPMLTPGRCLAHMAVDPDVAYVTTVLARDKTVFLPFNRGRDGGAGNPIPSISNSEYATAYLWEQVLTRDSLLNLVERFIHEVPDEPVRTYLFPRYHQLDAVRRLLDDARKNGAGQRYLIQHSAGSGKSNSIAWLAHQLTTLHDDSDERIFDTIIVLTDRRVLDRQLQETVKSFEQTLGLVENIDKTSRDLQAALESGKQIIVSTLQKFPVIANKISSLAGSRFALIVDEAHSSMGGETSASLKAALAPRSLEEAETEESSAEDTTPDLEDVLNKSAEDRRLPDNASIFAFTATPKQKTLQLFGVPQPDGSYEPFSLYSMRQAIEEGFILDVLANYTTYRTYWKLVKTASGDPRYDQRKASAVLRSFVELSDHAIEAKASIALDHLETQVVHRIGGQAKAMLVTRSRLHAVRHKLAIDKLLAERGSPHRALVAFSGTVTDPDTGTDHTEASMNGISEAQTANTFKTLPAQRLLIVAEKFQTGFDEPLLHTMYIDKKLSGVHAVQTLSRLNRIHPLKSETMVLDFVNDATHIKEAFEDYYDRTILSEGTDPNVLYDLERRIMSAGVVTTEQLDDFAHAYFGDRNHLQVHAAISPIAGGITALQEPNRGEAVSTMAEFVRLYAFLSQVATFTDADLERLYVCCRLVLKSLDIQRDGLPREVAEVTDLASYRIKETFSGGIDLDRGKRALDAIAGEGRPGEAPGEHLEPLSEIIRDLNDRFGTDFSLEDVAAIEALEHQLREEEQLAVSIRTNTRDNARLSFEHVANKRIQSMIDTNFKLYKRINDDPAFGTAFLDLLFDRLRGSIAP